MRLKLRAEGGQSTVEWVGLVLLMALLTLGIAAVAGARLPGLALPSAIAKRLACAAGLGESGCAGVPDPDLAAEYGAELAALARRRVPTLAYEEGMRALPVDFRACREDPCSLGAESGEVLASDAGEPVTLFVHVVDCREEAAKEAREDGFDCSGERAGNLYLQYWAYYPGSQSLRALPGDVGHHADDWESFQLRIGPGGAMARASSHHGYNHGDGAGNWLSDAGITRRAAWGPAGGGRYYVSGGSHAGHAFQERAPLWRWTPGELVRLVPVEAVARGWGGAEFAVTPPWRKHVYRDPESTGTD
jgi:hypothetical protein